ncbi:MAG TPA: P63C domain-containing protein [Acidobacteriaceae bacterium]
MVDKKIDPNAAGRALSKLGASKGGEARAAKLTQAQRSDIARKAVQTRWAKKKGYVDPALSPEEAMLAETTKLPEAKYKGFLSLMNLEIPCYVLDTEERVIGRTATTEMLSGFKGQGDLEGYLRSQNLKPFINIEYVVANMVSFSLPEVEQLGRSVKGLPTDLLIEICRGLVQALEASQRDEVKLTPRQLSMSVQASMFLVACAKVGLDALVDEATGYQHDRAENALQVKLRAYLEKEMRKWEKTFPDDLWLEFARLTNWKGTVTRRPKYWGYLVMNLVYAYLDADVAKWLKENAPKPQKGQNYHQWLTSQYGLKKLVEHIWMLIGVSKTCHNLDELKHKMERMFGKSPLQYDIFIDAHIDTWNDAPN